MKSLSPLILFIILYLGVSLVTQDFYSMPIIVAFLISTVYALLIGNGMTLEKRVETFAQGAGSQTMMLMLIIFILSGAFAASAKAVGAVDSTVNLMLDLLPPSFVMPGLFFASCFISFAIGTSCGTIAALTPVAVGIAQKADIDISLMMGLVVGGTYFGDNLSVISDTTIVATQTQGCSMKDKFRVNIGIVLPVAVIMFVAYCIMGANTTVAADTSDYSFLRITPYLLVIVTALCGMNVIMVLLSGLLLTGIVGICEGSLGVLAWFKVMNEGVLGMGELIVCAILAGGMLELIKAYGGVDYIIRHITRRINSARGGEFSIAALVTLVNVCTANNTVAILTVGNIVRSISERFGIDARKSASILDTMSCFTQGLLPYGAQALIAAGLASITPVEVLSHLYYPLLLGAATMLSIFFRYPRKYS